jgi:antagonist of KipI
MGIKVIKAGIYSSIQDLGRKGFRSIGIGPGGSMDFFAAAVSNFIAGNDENMPVIEMHFPAAEMLFEEAALICIGGAEFDAHINGQPVKNYAPLPVKKGSSVSFKKINTGARVYLAVHGGIKTEQWLGSYSTDFKAKAGGYEGRLLQKGDDILLNNTSPVLPLDGFSFPVEMVSKPYQDNNIIQCMPGPEWEMMDETAKKLFTENDFVISSSSDRMGYRLSGKNILLKEQVNLVSSAVNFGTVQLLPGGQLIVLMAGHQTTGGYPRIANVISAQLPKLSQLAANSPLRFQIITEQEAEDALISLQQRTGIIKNYCKKFYALH